MKKLFAIKRLLLLFAILFPIFALASGALAGKEKLTLKTEGFLVKEVITKEGKKEEITPLPEKVYPGDVIEYRIKATNVSDGDLKNIVIGAKIPEGTTYVPGSASDSPEFSIDRGKTFSKEPVKYTVIVDGKKVTKTATPDMYTNIRWRIPVLKPGEEKVFKYRVQVKPIKSNK